MAKLSTTYRCTQCDKETTQWQGRCFNCGAWESLETVTQQTTSKSNQVRQAYNYAGDESTIIHNLETLSTQPLTRINTGISEFDRVLGGGLVSGSVTLLGGDPGVGKSTLLLQSLCHLNQTQTTTLYVSGEESPEQVAIRAQRMQLPTKQCRLLASTQVNVICHAILESKAQVVVIDSIQTMLSEQSNSAPGTVSQVKESAMQLTQLAKQKGIALLMIGHMTKDGQVAGPRVLEHMVDTVLYIEGEKTGRYRLLRATKNRFGAVDELGVFAMLETGMKPVKHPSLLFLSQQTKAVPGSTVLALWEGSRAFLVECQALADQSIGQDPRRVVIGMDTQRVNMLLAILHKHAQIASFNQDIFINVVGGLKITETAADLALVLAVYSSIENLSINKSCLVIGELGLNGEVRPVAYGQARVEAAFKHGIKHVIAPKSNQIKLSQTNKTCQIHSVEHIRDAIQVVQTLKTIDTISQTSDY